MVVIVLAVAAGESALGLGVLVSYHRLRGSVSVTEMRLIQS